MENLSLDIVLEIRSRLPIKSILQCRRVCKLWRNLFEKPKPGMLFTKFPSNLVGHIQNTFSLSNFVGSIQLYYREQSSAPPRVSLNLTGEQQNFHTTVTKLGDISITVRSYMLIGSCNGLVCYKTYQPIFAGMDESKFGDFIYVFNPVTGERVRLRKLAQVDFFTRLGFGYCSSTDAFKVVHIRPMINSRILVQVYTIGDGCGWTEQEFTYAPYRLTGAGVFANGALHWLNITSKWDIVAFDLTDETFRTLPSPPCRIHSGYSSFYDKLRLASLGGNLCLCLNRGGRMDIWAFKKKKNMNISLRSSRLKKNTYFNSFSWIKVFTKKWDSKFELRCRLSLTKGEMLLWQNGVFSCYDLETTPPKKLWYAEGPQEEDVQAIPHTPSLVSSKDLGEELVDC